MSIYRARLSQALERLNWYTNIKGAVVFQRLSPGDQAEQQACSLDNISIVILTWTTVERGFSSVYCHLWGVGWNRDTGRAFTNHLSWGKWAAGTSRMLMTVNAIPFTGFRINHARTLTDRKGVPSSWKIYTAIPIKATLPFPISFFWKYPRDTMPLSIASRLR